MKKYLIISIAYILMLSCSSSQDSKKELPEYFDIKIEIEGLYTIQHVHIAINALVKEKWEHIGLPFIGEYRYYTTGNEISNTACKCLTISSWAYLSSINEMQVFNLYVDGNLVDSTTITSGTNPDGTIKPAKLEFVYNP